MAEVVVKVPHGDPGVVAAVRIDALVVDAARAAGVRTPQLLALDQSCDLLPVPYSLHGERVHWPDAGGDAECSRLRGGVAVGWAGTGQSACRDGTHGAAGWSALVLTVGGGRSSALAGGDDRGGCLPASHRPLAGNPAGRDRARRTDAGPSGFLPRRRECRQRAGRQGRVGSDSISGPDRLGGGRVDRSRLGFCLGAAAGGRRPAGRAPGGRAGDGGRNGRIADPLVPPSSPRSTPCTRPNGPPSSDGGGWSGWHAGRGITRGRPGQREWPPVRRRGAVARHRHRGALESCAWFGSAAQKVSARAVAVSDGFHRAVDRWRRSWRSSR